MQDSPENSAGELVPAQIALGQEAVPSLPVCPSLPAASSSLVCLEVESSDEEMASLENSPLSPPERRENLVRPLIAEFNAAIHEMETLPAYGYTDTLLDDLDGESPCEAG